MRKTDIHRFVEKVAVSDGCWTWMGCKFKSGYGAFRVRPRTVYAHRFSYESFVKPIPSGLHIDHLCRNRGCVNPSHLEPIPMRENILRGFAARGSTPGMCKRGHARTAENTYISPKGMRNCRKCNLIKNHEFRQRQAAATGKTISAAPKYQ